MNGLLLFALVYYKMFMLLMNWLQIEATATQFKKFDFFDFDL